MLKDPELLTPAELKARLKISTRTYSRLVAAGLPCRLVGTMKRFVWSEVLAFLPRGERAPVGQDQPTVDLVGYLKQRARRFGQ